MAVKRPARVGA